MVSAFRGHPGQPRFCYLGLICDKENAFYKKLKARETTKKETKNDFHVNSICFFIQHVISATQNSVFLCSIYQNTK